jgi:DNA-binding NtrC family response regulator
VRHSFAQVQGKRGPPGRPRGVVYLIDPDAKRSHAVTGTLALSTGLEVRETSSMRPGGNRCGASGCVIGISNPVTNLDLDRVREIKKTFRIIAVYLDAASSVSLGRRCEVLLAGASLLLDRSSETFAGELSRAVGEAFERWTLQLQEEQATVEMMRQLAIIGQSPVMLDVFRLAKRISHFSDLPVLITGETGTGKELLAQAIYKQDEKRCHGPFVPLNCAAISRELSDSELFGHRKGSFTGAGQDRPGLFRSAHRGVLFLDEIGELDLCLQAKLLRVLQENSVLGVGEDREARIDVRVLAATHRDLPKMVAAGNFREDLYHRLNVVLLHIPPLRERVDDIAALVEHFLQKHEHLAAKHPVTAAPSFVEALEGAFLPGNARELENLVRRALISSEGLRPLEVTHLPSYLWREISSRCTENGSAKHSVNEAGNFAGPAAFIEDLLSRHHSGLEKCIGECEDMLVHAVLASCHGNQAQAARMLGITPRSMYNKLRKGIASSPNGKPASA